MDSLTANALGSWTSFMPIEAAAATAARITPALALEDTILVFRELAERGALISERELMGRLEAAAPGAGGESIAWLAIPTRDRRDCLERALDSYVGNMRMARRACDIFVSDDSRDSSADVEKQLGRFAARQAQSLWYAGSREKMAFIQAIAAKGDIPSHVLEFALFGTPCGSRTPGASRNAILLQTFGSLILSVDDDTVCRPARVLDAKETEVLVAGHGIPTECWYIGDGSGAGAFVESVSIDVIGEHERTLGRSLASVITAARAQGQAVRYDEMCVHILTGMLSRCARIRATSNGSAGDSGYHSDLPFIASPVKSTRSRIQSWKGRYREILDNRQVVRQASQPLVLHADSASVGMCLGIDNRSTTPPFMPESNNEDGVFAQLFGRCDPNAYAYHLPFVLDHSPDEPRAYAADRDVATRISDLVLGCLTTWRQEPGIESADPCLASFGRHLRQIASLSDGEFVEFVTVLQCAKIGNQIEALESRLMEDSYAPYYWAEDIEARIECMRRASEASDFALPLDVAGEGDNRIAVTKAFLAQYGDLLQLWPLILQRTLELREDGITLGRRIAA